jgi:hypothetical protein
MPEPTGIDNNRALLRRTLIVAGAMVGGCVLVVGTLTLVATAIVDHAVGPSGEADGGGLATQTPAKALHPAGGSGPKPPSGMTGIQRK